MPSWRNLRARLCSIDDDVIANQHGHRHFSNFFFFCHLCGVVSDSRRSNKKLKSKSSFRCHFSPFRVHFESSRFKRWIGCLYSIYIHILVITSAAPLRCVYSLLHAHPHLLVISQTGGPRPSIDGRKGGYRMEKYTCSLSRLRKLTLPQKAIPRESTGSLGELKR